MRLGGIEHAVEVVPVVFAFGFPRPCAAHPAEIGAYPADAGGSQAGENRVAALELAAEIVDADRDVLADAEHFRVGEGRRVGGGKRGEDESGGKEGVGENLHGVTSAGTTHSIPTSDRHEGEIQTEK